MEHQHPSTIPLKVHFFYITVAILLSGIVFGSIGFVAGLRLVPHAVVYNENNSMPIPPGNTPVPTPTVQSTDEINTYTGNGFSFNYPSSLSITQQLQNETVFGANTTKENLISLKSSSTPFPVPTVGSTITAFNRSTEVKYLSTESAVLAGNPTTIYNFSCGPDCGNKVVYYNIGNTYYQLVMYVSGGGLSEIFNQIIKSFKFGKANIVPVSH